MIEFKALDFIFLAFQKILAIGVPSFLIFLFLFSLRKTRTERGKEPEFREQCGVKLYNCGVFTYSPMYLSWPLARHTIYNDTVVINKFKKPIILPINNIKEVQIKHALIGYRILYHHDINDFPTKIIVYSWFPDIVKRTLQNLNVKTN